MFDSNVTFAGDGNNNKSVYYEDEFIGMIKAITEDITMYIKETRYHFIIDKKSIAARDNMQAAMVAANEYLINKHT